MEFYELKSTQDNLCTTYLEDTIGRNQDIKLFAKMLDSLSDSCSIALDGSWGSGKTFFVKQTKLYIDAHNNMTSIDNETRDIFLDENTVNQFVKQVTVYYDAWENDNDSDPILSLIYSIISNVDTDYTLPNDSTVFSKGAAVLEIFSGRNFSNLYKELKGNNPLDVIRKEKNIEDAVNDFLDSLLAEKGDRLIVFIDELDRCKPSYAVRLLERIKHYFENERITFVFSVNIKELQHTIKRFYGESFDACRYLDRFFDLRVGLPPVDQRKFFSNIDLRESNYTYDDVCISVVNYFNFTLRETCRYITIAKIAAHEPTHNDKKYDFSFSEGKAKLFCLHYIVPIMIGLKIVDINKYEDFVEGRDRTIFIDIIKNLKISLF